MNTCDLLVVLNNGETNQFKNVRWGFEDQVLCVEVPEKVESVVLVKAHTICFPICSIAYYRFNTEEMEECIMNRCKVERY